MVPLLRQSSASKELGISVMVSVWLLHILHMLSYWLKKQFEIGVLLNS